MTTPTSRDDSGRSLSTADLAAASRQSQRVSRAPNEIESADFTPGNTESAGTPDAERRADDIRTPDAQRRANDIRTPEAQRRADDISTPDAQRRVNEMRTPDVERRGDDMRTPTGAHRANDLQAESLAPLFDAEQAESYRNRWVAIQSSFVDDPSAAVRAGDELVAQVMAELAESFAEQRHRFESELGTSGSGNTENLRVALRSYRSFFERLLSL